MEQTAFDQYTKHVLEFEGKTSNDPDDTAVKCAPFKGAYHTNKGVTYCTFIKYAKQLGLPATYKKFEALTNADVAKFILVFAAAAEADELPTKLALSVTEAAWGSGPVRAVKHLQDAINSFPVTSPKIAVDGDIGPGTLRAAARINEGDLYRAYWKERTEFIETLLRMPKFSKWKNGWRRRITSFRALFG